MIRYRPFRNTDPPWLVEIWRSHAPMRGIAEPMSVALFDRLVLAKPYFDRQGLIVATDDEQPVGFVHAGFGPNDDESGLSTETGITCALMVHPHAQQSQIETELLAHSEEYLRRAGAKALYAGGVRKLNPFYWGLYGGSDLPGVLDADAHLQEFYRSHGYRDVDRALVLQRSILDMRPVMDRRRMQIGRQMALEETADPRPASWWQACTYGVFDHFGFALRPQAGGSPVATATFCSLAAFSAGWGMHAAGLRELTVEAGSRRAGLATYLLYESCGRLRGQGITLIEAQAMQNDVVALELYRKLAFKQVDQGAVLRKE